MVSRFLFLLCLIGYLGGVLQAQDRLSGPLITSETVSDVALSYISQATKIHALQTRPFLLQEFVYPADVWSRTADSYRVSIVNLERGKVEATFETHLGLVDAGENYMLSQSGTGFRIWDLQTYQEAYQQEVLSQGYYGVFVIQDTQAVVGNHTLFHVIDLETGKEVDRYYNSCDIPAWLYSLLEATCVDDAVVSPFQIVFDSYYQRPEKEITKLYPVNNLRIS